MWLLHEETARAMRKAAESGIQPPPEFVAEASKPAAQGPDGFPPIARLAGDTLEIAIKGVLTKERDFFALFFGGGNTTYSSIIEALTLARGDDRISRVVLRVDSPGGSVDGLFDTLAAIEDLKAEKNVEVVGERALSGAFGISAVAGKITATSVGSEFGSIGVAVSIFQSDDIIDLTNSESPKKRPDASTQEGRDVIVEYLDAIFDLFIDAIARGRVTNLAKATKDFGRGAVLLSQQALDAGMIDGIRGNLRVVQGARAEDPAPSNTPPDEPAAGENMDHTAINGGQKQKESRMDLNTLRLQHPALFEAVVQEGVNKERDRVKSHIVMGREAGDLGLAAEAIENGDEMSQTMMARYMAAGMNKKSRDARQVESDQAGTAVDGAVTETDDKPEPDLGDKVVALLDRRNGKKSA